MASPLRKIDVWLLRHHPHLWSLQLPLYLLMVISVTVLAYLVARWTPVELGDMPDIGRNFVFWALLALLLLAIWARLFLSIVPQVQRKGAVQRTAAVLGTSFAVLVALAPTYVYVHTLEGRMESLVESQAEKMKLHVCATNYYRERAGQPVTDSEIEKACFSELADAWAMVREISDAWDSPYALAGRDDLGSNRSRDLALTIEREGFADERRFPYRRALVQSIAALALGYLAYVLHFCRHAPRATFGMAVAVALAIFGLAWLLSLINPVVWPLAASANFSLVIVGFAALLAPARLGKYSFFFELGLCMLPLLGLSFALWGEYEPDELFETAAIGCWAVLLFSLLFYAGVERFRCRPA